MSRDRTVGDTFYIAFTTRAFATGIPTVLSGTPVVSAYEDASLTQITAGITLGVDHDSVVGLNMLTIVATGGNGFESGKDYQLAITTGSVGGVSVVGEIVGQFSLGLSAAAVDLANGTDGLGALKGDTSATLTDTADMQPKVSKIPLSDGTITWNSTALASVNAECDTALADFGPPTLAQMNARTLATASYFDPAVDTVATVTTVTNQVTADVTAISGDTAAADNLELQYDGTGITGDTFPATQAQLGSLSTGSSAISVQAESYVLTTGTQSLNGVTDTETLDSIYHEHTDTAGVMDLYYQFDVTGSGIAASATIDGRINSANDTITIYAWNWSGASWDVIDTLTGTATSVDSELRPDLLVRHTGSGADLGKVRIRFAAASGLTSATLRVDRILTSYAVVAPSIGYADGAVWVDTVGGTAGTVSNVHGVADNPVLTWADALTIASNVGVQRFRIVNGSSVTLTADSTNHTLIGENWALALGGQDVSGIAVIGANSITGTGINGGTKPRFMTCLIGDVTLPACEFIDCCLAGDVTGSSIGDYFFVRCHSLIAGTSAPSFDFGAAVGSTNANFRGYSGGIEIKNMGVVGSDVMSLEGDGQLVINANCSAGSVVIRGNYTITDNAGGALTISDDARFAVTQITSDGAPINTTSGAIDVVTTNTDMRGTDSAATAVNLAIVDTNVDTLVTQVGTAGDGLTNIDLPNQTMDITGNLSGSVGSVTARVTANTDQISGDATSATNLSKSALGIEPGAAIAGTLSTTQMTTDLTEATDDHYNGRIIIFTTGVLKNQATDITDYTGATKLLTYTALTEAPTATDEFVIV